MKKDLMKYEQMRQNLIDFLEEIEDGDIPISEGIFSKELKGIEHTIKLLDMAIESISAINEEV